MRINRGNKCRWPGLNAHKIAFFAIVMAFVQNPSRIHDSQLIALRSIQADGCCQSSYVSCDLQVALGFLSFNGVSPKEESMETNPCH